MDWKTLLTLSVSLTFATISMAPTAAFAQFPPGRLRLGLAGLRRSEPEVLLHSQVLLPWGLAARPTSGLTGQFLARAPAQFLAPISAGLQASVPAVAARAASLSSSRSGGYGYGHGGSRYGYRAAYAAGAYAAGAYSGDGYGREYSSGCDCYYVYSRSRRLLVCD